MSGEKLGQRTQRPVVSGVPAVPPGKGSPLDGFSDDTLVEVELGAMREIATMLRDYRERLGKLEQAEDCDACQAQIDALNARIVQHDEQLDAGTISDTQQLLALLRANGVTRYKRTAAGDVEIELSEKQAEMVWAAPPGWAEPSQRAAMQPDDAEPNATEGALEDELSPLPAFSALKQQSEDLRRQHEADRSGVEVTEVDDR